MQATHSGRYSKPGGAPAPLIAYNNPIFEKDNLIPKDRIVTDEYLDKVKEALINGAKLAEKAGFDGVDKNKICICCSKCTETMRKPGGTPGCVIRDRDVYLPIYNNLCK